MKPHLFRNKLLFLALVFDMTSSAMSRSAIRPNKLVTYSIPENRALKKALGYHEDTYLNFTELATKYGHKTETHAVTTEDGYILTVFRLLPKCKDGLKPYPVVMVHGIFDTADVWVLAGTKVSLGFVLANNCYDVWAANHRGNFYSRRHVQLDPDKDPEFWNYSFDEHGNFDVPAVVDYVLQNTGKSQVHYIGHSQGTTDGLVMNSLRPKYNDKIRLSIHLAPVAWMKNIISPGPVLAAYNVEPLKVFLESAGVFELLAKDRIVHNLLEFLCKFAPIICENGLSLSTGHKVQSINVQTLSVAFGHLLSGGSVKTLVHLAQLIVTGRFQRYNEGRRGNIERYGASIPPEYNVSLITSPVVLISAKNDWVSSLQDVDKLASKLPNLVENYIIPEPSWSHHNHIWGKQAPVLEHPTILKHLNRFSNV